MSTAECFKKFIPGHDTYSLSYDYFFQSASVILVKQIEIGVAKCFEKFIPGHDTCSLSYDYFFQSASVILVKQIKMGVAKCFEKFIPGHDPYFLSLIILCLRFLLSISEEDRN